MKKSLLVMLTFLFSSLLIASCFAQSNTTKNDSNKKEALKMKRFIVERSFPDGLEIPMNNEGDKMCSNVISTNSEDQVTWVQSYVSTDKKKTYCVYDAPSAEAIKKAAKNNHMSADKITEVRVLDPYFYK